jgi:hypothetical protein|tara:strand:- start:2473 stop:2586 length:114 start_codon:yes stop_codon:yes gene_type:complete
MMIACPKVALQVGNIASLEVLIVVAFDKPLLNKLDLL